MPSRRQPAAALSFLDSISAATVPALARADSRDSMANIAFRAADAQSRWLGGTFESTLRMKCTMHRWYFARGSIEFTVETSPAHRSPTTSVYGQINVYGVTTKSERHKRSYWTRTADGNGIGGRKAPVPYGS